MALEIIQIVPRLPPTISGVGDYAYLLARELRERHEIHTRFIVCDTDWSGGDTLNTFSVQKLKAPRSDELLRCLLGSGMPNIVLLQYVGYGYERRGCPTWLVNALQEWRRSCGARRLIIMFHELYAFGPPWRSSFWASPLQRWIAAQFAKLADRCVTNLRRYGQWLGAREPRHFNHILAMPVFSNLGEQSEHDLVESRPPNMIIFGSAQWVKDLLGQHREKTLKCAQALGLQQLITVGSPVGTVPPRFPVPIKEHGQVDASIIAKLMRSSRVGLTDYFPGHLAKSGVFAAYAAFGLVPVLPRLNRSELDGCVAGETYLVPEQISTSGPATTVQKVADNARKWYQEHNLNRTTDAYADLIRESVLTC
ncbi:MAG: hypothetical protein L0Y58_16205 [Verrucomicrobia subdivision 3 bacterium]|nr:hypothetical protein [Limisphaerales bacterium]